MLAAIVLIGWSSEAAMMEGVIEVRGMKWKTTWDEETAKTTSVRLFAAGSSQQAGPTRKRLYAVLAS